MSSSDSPSALDVLRHTLLELESYLGIVKHLVVSLSQHASLCFTFKDSIDQETGVRQQIDRKKALAEIVDDLDNCWKKNHTLTLRDLFSFYVDNKVKPVSEVYLAKFVISLNHPLVQAQFQKKLAHMVSGKIMWVSSLVSDDDVKYFDQETARVCQAIHLKRPFTVPPDVAADRQRWMQAFCYEDNPFVQRIVIQSNKVGGMFKLPTPSTPLTDTTPRSALVELTLQQGINNTFDLTQLNNKFFPNLTHLSVTNGSIRGHLDSRCVSSLRTLILEPLCRQDDVPTTVDFLVRERARSLIQSGFPWQIIATRTRGGWSLASYEEPTTHLLDEAKEASFQSPQQSLPRIRELMLVAFFSGSLHHEWNSQFNGKPPLDAAALDPNGDFLAWKPERVQKITAFRTSKEYIEFDFKLLGFSQTHSLTSLSFYNLDVILRGAALPCLQSLELNGGEVSLSGTFSDLKTLSIQETMVRSAWKMSAPKLESLCCHNMIRGWGFTLRPELLHQLSHVQMTLTKEFTRCPRVLSDEDPDGMTIATYAVLGHSTWHFEFTLNMWDFHDVWCMIDMKCQRLTLHVNGLNPGDVNSVDKSKILELWPMSRVKILTVTEKDCHVVLNRYMPNLIECTVPSLSSFGPELRCAALQRVRFTDKLSDSDQAKCLEQATYEAFESLPREIIFAFHNQTHKTGWESGEEDEEEYVMLAEMEVVD